MVNVAESLARIEIETNRFRRAVNTWEKETAGRVEDAMMLSIIDMLSDVIRAWPVDTGRSRAAWYAFFIKTGEQGPGGGRPRPGPRGKGQDVRDGLRRGRATIKRSFNTFSVTLENNVNYAGFVEKEAGVFVAALSKQTKRFIDAFNRLGGSSGRRRRR